MNMIVAHEQEQHRVKKLKAENELLKNQVQRLLSNTKDACNVCLTGSKSRFRVCEECEKFNRFE